MDLILVLKSKVNGLPLMNCFDRLGFRFVAFFLVLKKQVTILYSLFFVGALIVVSLYNKNTLHLLVNKYNTAFLDVFFKYTTFLGDGILFGVLVLVFLLIKERMSLVFLVSGLLTLLITHFLKRIIFKGIPRPVNVLGEDALHLVEGVKIALRHSFPSGHTTTAFAIATILCLYFANCKSQYIWFLLAIIAGLSRVYLSQHYLIDVFVGSFIGIAIGFLSMAFFCKPQRLH